MKRLLFICWLVLLSGCASVPMASLNEDMNAKQFSVSAKKSHIYLYRNESYGGVLPMTVSLDGKVAGQTGPQTYFMWVVDPGAHVVASHTENVVTLNLITEPGNTYFVWQEVKMGLWTARSALHQVDTETGKKGVAECKRAQSNF